MFCPHCGKQIPPQSNFCSACGAAAVPVARPFESRIVRPRYPRMIGGVCSGFAIHFGWDLTIVRVVLVVFTILSSGLGLLCYLAAWIILPEAPYALPADIIYPTQFGTQTPPSGPTGAQTSQGTTV